MNEKFETALIMGTVYLADTALKLSDVFKKYFDFNNPEIQEGLKSELDRTPFSSANEQTHHEHTHRLK